MDLMSIQIGAQNVYALKGEEEEIQLLLELQLAEDATQDGLGMHIVMILIITWIATMMVETVVDVMSTHNTAQIANAWILMEAGAEQRVLKQQQYQLCQQPMTQVFIHLLKDFL